MLHFSTSFATFLKSAKDKNNIARILHNYLNAEYYENGQRLFKNAYSLIIDESQVNYITFRTDGTISYLPAGKEHITTGEDDQTWSKTNRQNGKPSKVIRKLFTEKALNILKDKDFESFTNIYKNNYNADGYEIKIRPASEIGNVYCMDRVESGTIGGSCMNDDRDYLEIYESCSDLEIITVTNKEGLLCGRALLWKTEDGSKVMDRVYVSQDFLYEKFLDFAQANNLWRKKDFKSYANKREFITPSGDEMFKTFKVYTDTDFNQYPYIDTFSFGEDGLLTNNENTTYTYNNTDGTRSGDNEEDHEGESYDEINDEYISEDDAVYIENGERQYRGRVTHVDNCVCVGDSWYHQDDENIACVNGEYYTQDSGDITYVDSESEWYLSEDVVYSEEEGQDILRENAVEIDDNWYSKDSDLLIKIEDDYYLKTSEEVVEIEDDYYLKTSEEVVEIEDDYYLKTSEEVVEIEDDYYLKTDARTLCTKEGIYILRQLKLAI